MNGAFRSPKDGDDINKGIDRARKAQQEHEQKHDTQLEINLAAIEIGKAKARDRKQKAIDEENAS